MRLMNLLLKTKNTEMSNMIMNNNNNMECLLMKSNSMIIKDMEIMMEEQCNTKLCDKRIDKITMVATMVRT